MTIVERAVGGFVGGLGGVVMVVDRALLRKRVEGRELDAAARAIREAIAKRERKAQRRLREKAAKGLNP